MPVDEIHQVRPEDRHGFDERAFSAIVRHEKNECVVELACVFQMLHNTPDIPVEPIDHRGIDFHGAGRAGAFVAR